MSAWTPEELDTIDATKEVQLASRRADGTLRRYVTIWAVRQGDDVYVRSAYGYDNPWFQRALRSGEGRVRAAGLDRDVTFEVPGAETAEPVTAAYHAKYDRYGARIVGTVVSAEARRSTLRVVAR